MPELPEVERGRRIAEHALAGKRIGRVATVDDRIVYDGAAPEKVAAALTGRRVKAVGRRGKHLWLELDRRPWPMFHFGMTGRFEAYDGEADRPRFWRIELLAEDGMRLAMMSARRFGRIRLRRDPESEPPITELGFDPLLELPRRDRLLELLARRRGPIKGVLLDQRFAAGVGNWIADEILYQARIAPHRRACDLTTEQVGHLRTKLRQVVRKAVEVEAEKERFPRTWLFHHRWGKPSGARTHRGEAIVYETVAGRTAAWVPSVQR